MSGYYAPNGKFLATESGKPLVGAKLYTYQAGTTTLQASYQDADLTIANTNPVIMNAQGMATVIIDSSKSYDFVLNRADDSFVWRADKVLPLATAAELSSQVSTLSAAITAEATTRAANDGSEATARAAADTTLQNNINAITGRARGQVFNGSTKSGAIPVDSILSASGTPDASNTSGIYNSTLGKYTANATGWWRFSFSFKTSITGAGYVDWYIAKNGSGLSANGFGSRIQGATDAARTVEIFLPLVTNEYVDFHVYVDNNGGTATATMLSANFQFFGD